VFEKFRDEWKAAGEALDRNEARRARAEAKAPKPQPQSDDTAAVVAANTATIAGNVANSVVNQ